jgi:hypothetical protein
MEVCVYRLFDNSVGTSKVLTYQLLLLMARKERGVLKKKIFLMKKSRVLKRKLKIKKKRKKRG